jgi:hypothetical protein
MIVNHFGRGGYVLHDSAGNGGEPVAQGVANAQLDLYVGRAFHPRRTPVSGGCSKATRPAATRGARFLVGYRPDPRALAQRLRAGTSARLRTNDDLQPTSPDVRLTAAKNRPRADLRPSGQEARDPNETVQSTARSTQRRGRFFVVEPRRLGPRNLSLRRSGWRYTAEPLCGTR